MVNHVKATDRDLDKCKKSPTGEHVWNWSPRPDNQRLGTCRYCELQRMFEGAVAAPHIPIKGEVQEIVNSLAQDAVKTLATANKQTTEDRIIPIAPTARSAENAAKEAKMRSMLIAGDRIALISKEAGLTLSWVYTYHRTHEQELIAAGMTPRKKWGSPKKEPAAKSVPTFSPSCIGGIMSQVNRVLTGDIQAKNAYPVMQRYRELLCWKKDKAKEEARSTQKKIESVDAIMAELKAVEEEGKKTVEKIAALVG